MRLVRIAIANVNTTVGAVRSNVDRALALAARRRRPTTRRSWRFPSSWSAAIRPRIWCSGARSSTRSGRELERFAEETAELGDASSSLGVTVARGAGVYNCAALVAPRRDPRPRPEGEAAHLQRLLRGAHLLARRARASYDEVRRRAVRRLSSSTSTSATVALEVCEDIWSPDGPMRRRCYAGAELVVNVSRLAVSARRRRHAARDDRHARRRQPVRGRLREPRRRQRRPDLRRRRLRRRRTAGWCSRRRASARASSAVDVDLDRTRRLRAREHHLAQRSARRSPRARADDASCRVTEPTSGARRELAYPGARAPELLSARRRTPPTRRAREFCEDLLDALALGRRRLLREDRRLQDASASRSPAGATPCSACSSRTATSSGASRARAESGGKGARDPARVLHADAATRRPRRARAAERRCAASSARRSRSCRSTRRSSASSRRSRRCSQPGETLDAE